MNKVFFISQPMAGRDYAEILKMRSKIAACVEKVGGTVCTSIQDSRLGSQLSMSKSIDDLLSCDCVVMAPEWENFRGCRIEKYVADQYHISVFYYSQTLDCLIVPDRGHTL